MQGIFAFQASHSDNIPKNEKLLFLSFDNIYKLYVLLLLFLVALKHKAEEEIEIGLNKNFPTDDERNPNYKFVNNQVLKMLENNQALMDFKQKYNLNKWEVNKELVDLVWKKIKDSKFYKEYMSQKSQSFLEDKELILDLFKNFVAPEEMLHDSFEADDSHWADDVAMANTFVMKTISSLKKESSFQSLAPLFKDEQDKKFASELFRKIILNDSELAGYIKGKTPNWDYERISLMDRLLMKMAIAEFLYFPSIPGNVSMNEYVEIAKEYSSPKSKGFINGVLNNVLKELIKNNKLNKNIRGKN